MRTTRVGQWMSVASGLGLMACSGKPAESPGGSQLGRSAEAPAVTCGPDESYVYVARNLRCPDGSNPIGGDLERARQARRGSMPAPSGEHILDVYDVQCEGGTATLYVDMYGCEKYQEQLRQTAQGTPQGAALEQRFQAGDLEGVLTHCRGLDGGGTADERAWCMAFVPASLYALGRDAEGLSTLNGTCTRLHPATPDSDARANHLALALLSLASLAKRGKFDSTEDQRRAIIESWLRGCEVPPAQFERVLESLPNE